MDPSIYTHDGLPNIVVKPYGSRIKIKVGETEYKLQCNLRWDEETKFDPNEPGQHDYINYWNVELWLVDDSSKNGKFHLYTSKGFTNIEKAINNMMKIMKKLVDGEYSLEIETKSEIQNVKLNLDT